VADDKIVLFIDSATQDPSIPEHSSGRCPEHDVEPEIGYGLEGGGCGVYEYCPVCGRMLSKTQDEEMT
jgi:hypothetical protein